MDDQDAKTGSESLADRLSRKYRYYVEGPGINVEVGFDFRNEACVYLAKLPPDIEQTAVIVRKAGEVKSGGSTPEPRLIVRA